MSRLAIVVPCYNEEEVLKVSSEELKKVLEHLIENNKISSDSYVLFVDDGSKDATWNLIEDESEKSDLIHGLKLAGNVGHQYALTAGLHYAKDHCDVSISIDADLQDDLDAIEKMIDEFHQGYEIVYGVRNSRKKDSFFKRTTAQGFYKVMHGLGVKSVYNHADFRLMSKKALEQFVKYKETNLFIRGIIPLIGLPTTQVFYERKERFAGESKYPLKKMLALAWEGISSFSVKPISFIMYLGFFIMFISFCAVIYVLLSYFLYQVQPGWASLMISIWFLGGVQLVSVGLLGQYIGKIYMEVKERPRYNIEKVIK